MSDQSISMIDYLVYRTIRKSIWTRFSHRSYSNALKLHSFRGSRKRPVPSVIKEARKYNDLRLNSRTCFILISLQKFLPFLFEYRLIFADYTSFLVLINPKFGGIIKTESPARSGR